jgi:hypothetical protein
MPDVRDDSARCIPVLASRDIAESYGASTPTII